jgi:PAS domain S-box-containing protein
MQTLALLNKVVESSPAIMFRWRAAENWPVEYVSKNVSQFGYTPAELISGLVPYSSIVHPDDLERVGREVMDFATRGLDQFAQEYRIIGRDGQIHWTDDRTVVERDRNGHITYYQGIVLDITERKQAELERERLLAEVEAAYRQYVRHEWQAYLNQQHQGDWRVEHQPTTSALVSSGNGQNNSALTTPLILQGQVIGNISLEDVDPHRQWSGEELALVEAVSQQLALTVENLRLFEDTQRLAAREQITRQITEKMRAAPDFESIIRVGIQEIARVLGSSHVLVELNTDDNKGIGL